MQSPIHVIPELAESKRIAFGNEASSGIHFSFLRRRWIPAFAGMTSLEKLWKAA